MIRRILAALLLLGCAGKSVAIGANPAGSDGGSPSVGSGGVSAAGKADGNRGGVDTKNLGGALNVLGGTANGATGGVTIADGGTSLGGSAVGGATIVPVVGCAQLLASGDSHLCVMYDDGHVACLGDNAYGQVGEPIGTPPSTLRTIPVVGATLLAAGGDHNCVLTKSGVECWGDNGVRQLGVETPAKFSPIPVLAQPSTAGNGMLQLVAGRHFSCSLDNLGHASCWGLFDSGASFDVPSQLPSIGLEPDQILTAGSGRLRFVQAERLFDVLDPNDAKFAPPAVRGATAGVVMNAIGTDHDCVLKHSGTVWCRGSGFFEAYTAVTELGTDVVEVKVGYGFTCVRSEIGEVRCLGASERGQLGSLPLPKTGRSVIAVPIAVGALGLSLGLSHACALMGDGSVRCWGALGDVAFGARPTTISLPDPDAACSPTGRKFWDTVEPLSRPADEFADSALAWGHEQCRNAGQSFDSCVRRETVVMNGCLQSLAADDQDYSTCAGGQYWDAAWCAANSDGDSASIAKCAPLLDSCGYAPPLVATCMRPLLTCDYNATPIVSVTGDQVCDGLRDCSNGFDEANCKPESDVFVCGSGETFPLTVVGGGEFVCGDGTSW